MSRADVLRRVRALRAMTVERGASPAEARAARVKADALVAKYGLVESSPPQARPRPRRPEPAHWPSGAIFPLFVVPPFEFNAVTGEAGPNVRVHHHRSAGNWRIEVFPDDQTN